jgi:hypothetical protein
MRPSSTSISIEQSALQLRQKVLTVSPMEQWLLHLCREKNAKRRAAAASQTASQRGTTRRRLRSGG